MKYYAHYNSDINDEYNIITHICEADDNSAASSYEYEITSEIFYYLNNKNNQGVLKTVSDLTLGDIATLKLENTVTISEHTVYLVGFIKNVLPKKDTNDTVVNFINCIRVLDDNEYYNDNLFKVTTKEIYNFLNTSINIAKMAFSKIYFSDDVVELNDISLINIISDEPDINMLSEVSEEADLDIYKKYLEFESKNLLLSRVDSLSGFHFYHFIALNNQLISAGYFITESNRQDKYIEIVEKSDPELLDILSNYLNIMDMLNNPYYFYKQYLTFKEELDNSDTMEECKASFDTYNSFFK